MRHFLITCILLLSCSMGTWAQNIVVTGVVTDAQKEPLIGVNVAVKDVPGLGAITDINGKYKINTWREDKFERSVANGTETVFVTLRFCVVRKQLKATLKPNAAGVQLPPHYYRNG